MKYIDKNSLKIKTYFIIVFFILVILIFGIFFSYFLPPYNNEKTIITIEKNDKLNDIGSMLKNNNIIRSKQIFILYSRLKGNAYNYKPGTYIIESPISLKNLNKILIGGPKYGEIRITIPEGYNIKQIAELFEKNDLIDKDVFLKIAKNGNFDYSFLNVIKSKDVKYKLEGFLFPDTYIFYKNDKPEIILKKILDRFNEIKNQLKIEDSKLKDIIILSSIIEKEAVVSSERPIISGIFYNRLKRDMKLESCATLQYALGKDIFSPVLTIEETKYKSPYNTYLNFGLPIGPICNPGLDSMLAALNPDKNEYLFFVSKGNGYHEFNKTYDEHEKAVKYFMR